MFSYLAYGLAIQSEIEIPEFGHPPAKDAVQDVQIVMSQQEFDAAATAERYCIHFTPREIILFDREVATFWIRGGREIAVTPAQDSTDSRIRLYLVGTVLSLLLYQRGLCVLHGSAIAFDGSAVAFIGESGWGKSSIAAALHLSGHPIMSDDVVPVHLGEAVTTFPGFPQVKLAADVARCLNQDEAAMLPLHPQLPKRGLPVAEHFSSAPLPLRCIYVLEKGTDLAIAPLTAPVGLMHLIRHSVPTRWFQPPGSAHFLQCAHLANRVPAYRLTRSSQLAALPDLARLVTDHLAQTQLTAVS